MKNKNANLQTAKSTKDDEFYTTYETVEKELSHYVRHFKGKTVLCNCDDPFESNFCLYFLKNFNVLGLKRLICTSYKTSKFISTHRPVLLDDQKKPLSNKHSYVFDISKFSDNQVKFSNDFISKILTGQQYIKKMKGDGDFRSQECIGYLKQSDIVVTNPPFSLFKEMVVLIMQEKKKFLLIGNQNALTYKEIFPLIQTNKVWTGYQFGEMKFMVPKTSEPRKTRYWVDKTGQKWRSMGNAMWLTNLDNERRHKRITLTKKYSPKLFPRFDNYNAINVKKIKDIPRDYKGIIAVPITIINCYNSEQFKIVGEANHGSDNEYDLFKPVLHGTYLFKKILIKVKPEK
jgi:hypothetical protein